VHTLDVRLRYSVRILPVGNEGLVLASDATSWRAVALLVQVIFVSASQINGRVWRLRQSQYNKLVPVYCLN
jgi:hypothetical protein